jgi:hypothetical protein
LSYFTCGSDEAQAQELFLFGLFSRDKILVLKRKQSLIILLNIYHSGELVVCHFIRSIWIIVVLLNDCVTCDKTSFTESFFSSRIKLKIKLGLEMHITIWNWCKKKFNFLLNSIYLVLNPSIFQFLVKNKHWRCSWNCKNRKNDQ